ncbi:MAG TPA: histidine kinase [Gemmatimonadaceae bacterium]|nr:histidine kinase [Gemmatimonadaceae bacterium]
MRSAFARYALAVASLAAALAVSLLGGRHDDALALCLAAIVLTTWLGGRGPGLVAAVLGIGAVDYAIGTYALRDAAPHAVLFVVSVFIVAWARDELNERRQSEQQLAGQYAIARIIAHAESWTETAPRLLAEIGRLTGWEGVALFIADRDGTKLKCRDVWRAEGLPAVVHRDEGLIGRVWNESAIASSYDGTTTIAGVPLRASRDTLGVLVLTSRSNPPPFDLRQRETLSAIGEQLGQFTVRRRVEQDRESLASLVQNSSDFIGIASLEGDWMFINPAGQKLVGLAGDEDVRMNPMRRLFVEDVTPAILQEGYWSGQANLRHVQTGDVIPVLQHIFTLTALERPVAFAVIGRDLTGALTARFAATLDERARVAREIHDSLLQGVTGIALQLRALLPHVTPSDTLQRIVELADHTSREARRAIWDLRSSSIADDITGALDAAARRTLAGNSIAFHMTVTGRSRVLPSSVRPVALRIIEEGLTNIVRHAGAKSVWLTVAYERRLVRITLADDGQGFDVSRARDGHWGMIGMAERAAEINANLQIRSTEGKGTEIVLELPISRRADQSSR